MLQGSYVALVTPFKNGSIDWTALESLIQFHLDEGTDGILLLGTTAETAGLASDEKEALLRFAIQKINRQVPVMIGTGTNNLNQTLINTQRARELGADSALVITPYYIKPTQAGMYEYFKTVAGKVDIPIVIYNVPGRTGVNMAAATTVKLAADCPNIIGIKEASANLVQATSILRDVKSGFSLMSGEDALNLPLMSIGAKGTISVTANVVPGLMHEHMATALAGDFGTAAKQHQHLARLNDLMFIETNPIPAKEALHMMGKIALEFRSPICPLQEANRELLRKGLQEYKLI
ncbi:MAG: 4-hydroxy-tetrahydrodipicolinate synthase [Candidatus Cloacimonetes bacterium]|jgi:4-hydroxy-tetrahydrodipicolinate synthase|nr:4-hydroxy-tetrahydrodipicolinate synthase [Candidatus Cloacimonadota bacterium]MDY0336663.1 4-hydroxy-tetrahydrodipicolinate synthase [Candidatus Cloacimonadaceae bacterium]MDD2543441.1 4-hydroxy-tetrahydrodipicolinate synthase [Candidatus Cloacimonadota bacterium]MDD2682771.1 4-hydroxy-tetrahydrodipicolinate synthase [Candidatus Cloacimonadota bacterium]MDD3096482.1 4-hydroxy-tetrahydrodipicolinate synthase [Candidatus Cloacimonadota bacterium]